MEQQLSEISEPSARASVTSAVAWDRSSILFSSCNESSASELRAFGELRHKQVICITAGGGRVLNLLLARPAHIWAIDLNPAQNFLLELKVAGMRALEHAAYLEFLGVRPCRERLVTYAALRDALSPAARAFFDARLALIRNGVLFQGKLERYLRQISKVLQLIRPFGVKRLFAFDDIAEQRAFIRKLDSLMFRTVAETACRRGMVRLFSGDPGFYRYVPEDVALHRAIYAGVIAHFNACLARDNPLMQLVFFGRIIHEDALPPYLNAATYPAIRAQLAELQLSVRTCTIQSAFNEIGPRALDAFSLSDISSYLDDAAHAQLFRSVLTAASSGARLVSRSNIHHRPLLPEHARRIARDPALEAELAVTDHSCVHKFLVGDVS